jgi:hypothetical protein
MRIKQMLYADSSLGKVQAVFSAKVKHRARVQLTIGQRTRVFPGVAQRTRSGPLVVARDAGAAKTSFLNKCCEDSAVGKDGKPLSGAAKTSFVKKCTSG